MINQRILDAIEEIGQISKELLKTKEGVTDEKLERYFCKFEKARMDMYDAVEQRNLFMKFGGEDAINCIGEEYEVELQDDILKLCIPETLPKIKQGINYTQKRIMSNISWTIRKYEGLFYDKSVIVIIKIYDNKKIWDADNRNIKLIHDGLIHGRIIKDDNINCSCYFVQGYYSEEPHTEVYVLLAEEITRIIDKKIGEKVYTNIAKL